MPQMPSWRGRVVGVRPFENRIATRRNRGSKSFAFRTRPHNGVKIEGQLQKRTRRRQPQSLYSKTATDKCATCASIGESLARLELRPCWRAAAPDDFALSCSPFDDSFWLRFFFFLFLFFSRQMSAHWPSFLPAGLLPFEEGVLELRLRPRALAVGQGPDQPRQSVHLHHHRVPH